MSSYDPVARGEFEVLRRRLDDLHKAHFDERSARSDQDLRRFTWTAFGLLVAWMGILVLVDWISQNCGCG